MTEAPMDDGVFLRVYRAEPEGRPRAGVVIMHEGFGMNDHIRDMCERYAGEGYLALAPALYDRIEKGVEITGYTPEGQAKVRSLRPQVEWDRAVKDMCAVADLTREAGRVGVIGYCWGGSFAWLAATRCSIDAAVTYYGGDIMQFIDEWPKCPIMGHFGERDEHAPPKRRRWWSRKIPEHRCSCTTQAMASIATSAPVTTLSRRCSRRKGRLNSLPPISPRRPLVQRAGSVMPSRETPFGPAPTSCGP